MQLGGWLCKLPGCFHLHFSYGDPKQTPVHLNLAIWCLTAKSTGREVGSGQYLGCAGSIFMWE